MRCLTRAAPQSPPASSPRHSPAGHSPPRPADTPGGGGRKVPLQSASMPPPRQPQAGRREPGRSTALRGRGGVRERARTAGHRGAASDRGKVTQGRPGPCHRRPVAPCALSAEAQAAARPATALPRWEGSSRRREEPVRRLTAPTRLPEHRPGREAEQPGCSQGSGGATAARPRPSCRRGGEEPAAGGSGGGPEKPGRPRGGHGGSRTGARGLRAGTGGGAGAKSHSLRLRRTRATAILAAVCVAHLPPPLDGDEG